MEWIVIMIVMKTMKSSGDECRQDLTPGGNWFAALSVSFSINHRHSDKPVKHIFKARRS